LAREGVNAALQILSSFGKSHHLAIDVGAHESETAAAVHAVGLSNMKVISVEPNTASFSRLVCNSEDLKNNNFEIEYLPVAIGSKTGTTDFFCTNQSAVSGLLQPFSSVSERVPTGDHKIIERFDVQVITIDGLCQSHDIDHIDLLKIDTEGFDLEVLKGAREAIERNSVGIILSEVFLSITGKINVSLGIKLPTCIKSAIISSVYLTPEQLHKGDSTQVMGYGYLRRLVNILVISDISRVQIQL
jgi:FkbM family methyltransferase